VPIIGTSLIFYTSVLYEISSKLKFEFLLRRHPTGYSLKRKVLNSECRKSYKRPTKASALGKSAGRWTEEEHILFIEGELMKRLTRVL
jgi:hypothetical protein